MQQLRSDRPRRDGACPEDPGRRQGARRRHHRLVRPDHPVPGRDGQLRRRDGAPGAADPAADRWRDHLARPHGRQGVAASQRSGGLGQGRVPLGAGRGRAARRQAASSPAGGHREGLRRPARTARPEERAEDADAGEGAREPDADRVGRLHAAGARAGRRCARIPRLRRRRAARIHRLAAVLQRLGDEGQIPRHPQQPGVGRDGPQAVRRRPGDARHPDQGEVADRQRRDRLLPGERGRRRRRGLHRRDPDRGADHAAQPAPAGRAPRRHPEPAASATSSRPRRLGWRTTSAPSPSPRGSAARTRSDEFKAANDDYNAILLESLADRLAEAFAERMHQRVRKEFWGFQPDEQLDNDATHR